MQLIRRRFVETKGLENKMRGSEKRKKQHKYQKHMRKCVRNKMKMGNNSVQKSGF